MQELINLNETSYFCLFVIGVVAFIPLICFCSSQSFISHRHHTHTHTLNKKEMNQRAKTNLYINIYKLCIFRFFFTHSFSLFFFWL